MNIKIYVDFGIKDLIADNTSYQFTKLTKNAQNVKVFELTQIWVKFMIVLVNYQ